MIVVGGRGRGRRHSIEWTLEVEIGLISLSLKAAEGVHFRDLATKRRVAKGVEVEGGSSSGGDLIFKSLFVL